MYDRGRADGSKIDAHWVYAISKQLSQCLRHDLEELLRVGNEKGRSNVARLLSSEYFAGSGVTVGDLLRAVNHKNHLYVNKEACYRTRYVDGEWEIKVVQGHSERGQQKS